MSDRYLIGYKCDIFDETLPHIQEALLASQFRQIRQASKSLLAGLVKLCATAHWVHSPVSDSLQQVGSSNDRQC